MCEYCVLKVLSWVSAFYLCVRFFNDDDNDNNNVND